MTERIHADVAIVGAGPAGAHAAGRIARSGARVVLLDRRPEGEAGAQWLNDIPLWAFDIARVSPPGDDEALAVGAPFYVLGPGQTRPLYVPDVALVEADMRALGLRLAGRVARAPSARLCWGVEVRELLLDARGRAHAIEGAYSSGPRRGERVRVEARLFVDASGLAAVLRRAHPKLGRLCPPPTRDDLCVAAQRLLTIERPDDAQRYLDAHTVPAGAYLNRLGVAGGYSVVRAMVHPDLAHISILTGASATPGNPSGKQLLDRFCQAQPWVGASVLGGARAIPLRRPYTHLVAPGLALLGDAASQVFAAHGSGIGIGMIAARILADAVNDALKAGDDPGALDTLWAYPSRFHRRWGALLGFGDLFRRFTQDLAPDTLSALLASGLVTPALLRDGLHQRFPQAHLGDLPAQAAAATRHPRLLAKLAPVLAKLPMLPLAARSLYPERPDDARLERYERRMRALVEG